MEVLEQRASGTGGRRRRLERRLAELGWGRRRPWRLGASAAAGTPPRRVFEELGPVFAACGLHLAPRLDLLPEEDCFELAAIADRGVPTPPAAVDELLRRELAGDPGEHFARFEPFPVRSGLLTQTHRALSVDGEEMTAELVHPEIADRLAEDLEDLRMLAPALAARALPDATAAVGEALAQARGATRKAADLSLAVDGFGGPDGEVAGGDSAAAPRSPALRHSSPRLRIVAGAPQPTLAEILEGGVAAEPEADVLARHLWLRWLWQVLRTGTIPIDPRPRAVAVFEGRWPEFAASGRRAPAAVREALTEYLTAMAAADPDAACDAVLRLAAPRPAADGIRLRRRFRQLMPFRDSRRLGDGDAVAASLLLHQRLLGESGFALSPPLSAFYRSLFWVHHGARQLAPERQLLAESLEELRLVAGLGELRRQLDLGQLAKDLRQQAGLWLELPQKLDAALTRAARNADGTVPEAGKAGRSGNPAMVTAALVAAVAAVAAVGHQLSEIAAAAWGDPLGALLLLILGTWFLALAGRGKS